MKPFYAGQAVREIATGKVWYVTHVFSKSLLVQQTSPRNMDFHNATGGYSERAIRREAVEPCEEKRRQA